jgi:prolyl 4-hydroxylase
MMPYDLSLSAADRTAEQLSATPNVRKVPSPLVSQFLVPKFLSRDQCIGLMERIDSAVRPSTITDDIGDPEFRTSWTGDLDHHDPLVQDIDAMLCDLTGIAPAFGEPLQGQRYEVGQEFKAHTDYFEVTGVDFAAHTSVSGQRTWTAMAYLNTVDAGGATRFQHIDKIHRPEAGKLLIWCNLDANGNVNPWTLHHAMKVRKGRKYVITKWYRERPWPWG